MTALIDRTRCAALVITCSDFRFKSSSRRFAELAGLTDDYDLIARPGGIRSLVQPRSSAMRDSMEEEIRLLWSIHQFGRILFLNHVSCRAYDDIATPENEIDMHTRHLQAAEAMVESWFEGVDADPYLMRLSGGEIIVASVGMTDPEWALSSAPEPRDRA